MADPSVLFDTGPLGTGTLFRDPDHIIEAHSAEGVDGALQQMQAAQARGKWLAGVASYELGYALIPKIRDCLPSERQQPLLQFGVFDAPRAADTVALPEVQLTGFTPDWSLERYRAAFDSVHAALSRGDIYQANLTFPLRAHLSGRPEALYHALVQKQPVPHGAYVALDQTVLLSRSPELFFQLSADGKLRTRPMKGTIRRSTDAAEDAALKAWLRASEKNRAENLMITDLLRNDFSRISEVGSVKVPALFEVESYATVHQMISEVQAQLLPGQGLAEILRAVFPCGSITGAPKIKAMEILAGLEQAARDAYCGAIGWIAPDGSMEFNVAIRTLICAPSGEVRLNVGGGVVHDSTAEDEYAEALLKARFAQL